MAKLLILATLLIFSSKTEVSSVGTTTSPQQQNPQAGADKDPCEKSVFAPGFSGIPGSNGIPGMPGIPGAPGPQGQQGKDGAKGEPGVKGPRGMTGTRGQKGNPGSLGKNGAPGMMGIKGEKGHEGSRGSSGPPGIKGVKGEQGSKGEKGEIVNSAVSQTNWKQCVWKHLNDDRDSGKIKDCSINKLHSDTAIKVSFQGNMRVYGTSRKCNRWFFKFNGNECSGPMTIEAAVYNYWPSGNPELLHHRSFEGYCENIPQGRVTVELWVGKCPSGHTLGDAYTGWQSVSRIMIEEVSRAQS
ncbi:collagen triple helix repeat-containing protein 1-like [Pocillopora verrucosa]|uniref:collagen triple helix repeat-containing protein 1-like n=1 Tax=Pocillopora verrucosa TaxID=203993 RepID=UPI0033419CB5